MADAALEWALSCAAALKVNKQREYWDGRHGDERQQVSGKVEKTRVLLLSRFSWLPEDFPALISFFVLPFALLFGFLLLLSPFGFFPHSYARFYPFSTFTSPVFFSCLFFLAFPSSASAFLRFPFRHPCFPHSFLFVGMSANFSLRRGKNCSCLITCSLSLCCAVAKEPGRPPRRLPRRPLGMSSSEDEVSCVAAVTAIVPRRAKGNFA